MSVAIGRLAVTIALVVALWPVTVHGQASCRFVLGFAELAAQVGTLVVGECTEDQWVTEATETFDLGVAEIEVLPGTTIQHTTKGLLSQGPRGGVSFGGMDGSMWLLPLTGPARMIEPPLDSSTRTGTTPRPQQSAPSEPATLTQAQKRRCQRVATEAVLMDRFASGPSDVIHLTARCLSVAEAAPERADGAIDCFESSFKSAYAQNTRNNRELAMAGFKGCRVFTNSSSR